MSTLDRIPEIIKLKWRWLKMAESEKTAKKLLKMLERAQKGSQIVMKFINEGKLVPSIASLDGTAEDTRIYLDIPCEIGMIAEGIQAIKFSPHTSELIIKFE
ncbi:hypothetical protein KJA16_00880 [Patescibacteria group bacterium]|nr:hypothetical protein [Patescibacteria group bacterium]